MLQRLAIAFGQVKAANTELNPSGHIFFVSSKKKKKKTKKMHNNIINSFNV